MKKLSTKLPNLEDSFSEITCVIQKMEQGDLSLEESLKHFERGIQLIKHCQQTLETAEQKVAILLSNDAGELSPYGQPESHEGHHANSHSE